MKGKRLLASILALLLVVSLLPMTALAESTFDQYGEKIEEGQEFTYNITQNVTNYGKVINNGLHGSDTPPSIQDNNGTVVNNGGSTNYEKGTVENNSADGTVVNNDKTGTVVNNYGLVGTKDGNGNLITDGPSGNSGTIGTNNGTVTINHSGGTIGTNNRTVINNNEGGKVTNNEENGIVVNNGGEIQTNRGTVGKKEDGQVVAGSGNKKAISANYGTVISNNAIGIVGTNTATGKIEINNGTVGTLDDNGSPNDQTGNYGTIGINNKSVTFNQNGATIGTNNGTVLFNYGTVGTNAIDGVVYNEDTYFENAPRSLYNEDAAAPEENPNVDGVGTNFGTVYDKTKEGAKTTYYGLSWGDNVNNLNSIESFVQAGTPLNLDAEAAKASLSGYTMTGYTAFARNNGTDEKITSDITNYLMKAPVWLKIMWKQIVTAVEPASNEPEVKTTTIPTSLSADQVKVGAYVRRGNMTFRIIEVTDDAIRVATVGKLSEEDLADMLGCLKKHLSEAQLGRLIGEPELLERELVTYFFGDSREHIAFRASRDLFA